MRFPFSRLCKEDDLKRWLRIQTDSIDEQSLTRGRDLSRGVGAVVCFLGVVREAEGSATIKAIDYEAFHKMAEHQFHKIFDEVERRWPIESVRLTHRIGV